MSSDKRSKAADRSYPNGMETAALIISIASALGAIVAAIAATVQARASVRAADLSKESQQGSEQAETEALAIRREMNELLQRLAASQEQVVEIAQAQLPKEEFGWVYTPGHGDTVLLANDGNVTVYDVSAEGNEGVHVDEESTAQTLPPGDYVVIGVMPSGYGPSRRQITMNWRYAPDGEIQSATVAIRPNR